MQRNAKNHLSKADSAEFQQRWRALRDTWDEPIGITQFEDLCQRFDHDPPAFMTELRKKREHYLALLGREAAQEEMVNAAYRVSVTKSANHPGPAEL